MTGIETIIVSLLGDCDFGSLIVILSTGHYSIGYWLFPET
jgi:hypothetical protein